jgi:hypothetical protein
VNSTALKTELIPLRYILRAAFGSLSPLRYILRAAFGSLSPLRSDS